jgi:hypothetical protein
MESFRPTRQLFKLDEPCVYTLGEALVDLVHIALIVALQRY